MHDNQRVAAKCRGKRSRVRDWPIRLLNFEKGRGACVLWTKQH